MRENIDEFPAIRQYFPYQNLVSYSILMIGIRQFFTRQNFPPSKFCAIRYSFILTYVQALMQNKFITSLIILMFPFILLTELLYCCEQRYGVLLCYNSHYRTCTAGHMLRQKVWIS